MLHGWVILGVDFTTFALARRAAGVGRLAAFVMMMAIVLSSAFVVNVGINEYLTHKYAKPPEPDWRVFATSTPDFLAGYLVLLLPPTLGLFLGVPWRRDKPLLSGLLMALLLVILGLQAIVLLRTQSRFALVSLALGLSVFGLALWRARRGGLTLEPSSRWRLFAVVAFAFLFALGFARPVLARLRQTSATDNSTAFRLYTWRGCLKMAAANPLLGTGVGSWVELYPRYAVTGFTRLAHNGYLQMADECGLPGLGALLATLGFVGLAGGRRLSVPGSANSTPSQFLTFVAPDDDRIVQAGLLGGLAASAVQNLIDSDWYVFFLGLTFWALAGLAAPSGVGEDRSPSDNEGSGKEPLSPPFSGAVGLALGGVAALFALYMGTQALAAHDAQQADVALSANTPDGTATAEQGYADAIQWDPLNGRYAANLGLQVYFQREGRLPDAIAALRTATRLEPSSLNYAYLGTVLNANHQFAAALDAFRQGLRADPNSVDIRLTLAQMLPPPQSVDYCRQITVLEDSPVGRVRALGNVPEYRFAIADACVADAAAGAHDPSEAVRYYARAEAVLEAYADEGGTTDVQRQALMGDHTDPALDGRMRDLYAHVMSSQTALSPPADRPALQQRAAQYEVKFADVFTRASQAGSL
jgi:O-antigen ligase